MKIFLKKILFLSVSIILTVLIVFFLPSNKNSFMNSIIIKHDLIKRKNSPKIIFIGGSNLLYGIDSIMVEDQTKYFTVNMSISMTIGLKFMIESIKEYIKKGDIIIISPEYDIFFSDNYGNLVTKITPSLIRVIDVYPYALKYLNWTKQYKDFFEMIPFLFRVKLKNIYNIFIKKNNDIDILKTKKMFNIKGDYINHRNKKNRGKVNNNKPFNSNINFDSFFILNKFKEFTDKIGARVFFSCPAYLDSEYNINNKKIELLISKMKKNINITFLNDPKDYLFKKEFFFEYAYHLNFIGRNIRTKKIILDIKRGIFNEK